MFCIDMKQYFKTNIFHSFEKTYNTSLVIHLTLFCSIQLMTLSFFLMICSNSLRSCKTNQCWDVIPVILYIYIFSCESQLKKKQNVCLVKHRQYCTQTSVQENHNHGLIQKMQAMYNHKISPSFPFVSSSIHGTSDTHKTVKPQGENMQNRCRSLSFLDIYPLILLSCPSSLSPTLLPYFQT